MKKLFILSLCLMSGIVSAMDGRSTSSATAIGQTATPAPAPAPKAPNAPRAPRAIRFRPVGLTPRNLTPLFNAMSDAMAKDSDNNA